MTGRRIQSARSRNGCALPNLCHRSHRLSFVSMWSHTISCGHCCDAVSNPDSRCAFILTNCTCRNCPRAICLLTRVSLVSQGQVSSFIMSPFIACEWTAECTLSLIEIKSSQYYHSWESFYQRTYINHIPILMHQHL